MAFTKLGLTLSLLVLPGILFLSGPVRCDDEPDDKVFDDINIYRQSLNLPNLTRNDNANCLADKIASKLEDMPCESARNYSSASGTDRKIDKFDELVHKCSINENTIADAVILPACAPNIIPTPVPSSYPQSEFAKYLNDSNYSITGIGSEEEWVVVILSTNSSTGNFTDAASLHASISMANYMITLLFCLLLFWAS